MFLKGVSLLRARSKDNKGATGTVCQPPDRPGKANRFCGLVANFYSPKAEKIPDGRLALGNWLGCYRVSTGVGIFA